MPALRSVSSGVVMGSGPARGSTPALGLSSPPQRETSRGSQGKNRAHGRAESDQASSHTVLLPGRGPPLASSGTDLTHPMDRQGVRRDDVALLREGTQVDRSSLAQEQVDHSTASLADEMIVLAGLGIESGSLCVQKEGADLTLVDETVKVAINGGETDPRQLFVNPLVDLMGERVSVIALESFEHLLQLACRTFAGGPPHRLTSKSWIPSGSDRTVSGRGYQIDGFLSSNSPGDPVSSGGVEREELGPTLAHLPGVIDESERVSPRSGTLSFDQASAASINGVHLASSAACAQRAVIAFDTTTPY